MTFSAVSNMSIDDVKDLLFKAFRKQQEYWEEMNDFDEFKAKITSSGSFEKLCRPEGVQLHGLIVFARKPDKVNWREISISLIGEEKGEGKLQTRDDRLLSNYSPICSFSAVQALVAAERLGGFKTVTSGIFGDGIERYLIA